MTAARDELREALAAWRKVWGDVDDGTNAAPMRIRRAIDAVLAEEPAGVVVPPEDARKWAQWWLDDDSGPKPDVAVDSIAAAEWILSLPTAPPAPEGTDLRYWQDLANDRKAKLEEAREIIDRLIAALRGGS